MLRGTLRGGALHVKRDVEMGCTHVEEGILPSNFACKYNIG